MELTNILDLAVRLLTALAVAILIPWIKTKVDAGQLAKILSYVGIFVQAAEQLFTATEGEAKKQYVLERLAEKGIKIDGTALDAMIEAAVNELHQALVQPQWVQSDGKVQ